MGEVTIGGNRLGSGNKNKIQLHNFERSTHDLGYVWRSTMAAGTLVPFMVEVALPGDTFDIDLNCDVLTHPTIGPLFGSYKIQLDVFQVPIRLYNGKLHMNMLGIGMDMSKITFPQIKLVAPQLDPTQPIDNQHVNPSCIFSYLGIRGNGWKNAGGNSTRYFNAIPYLGYWDIYKNYYANKQEEIGVVIHKDLLPTENVLVNIVVSNCFPDPFTLAFEDGSGSVTLFEESSVQVNFEAGSDRLDPWSVKLEVTPEGSSGSTLERLGDLFQFWEYGTDVLIGKTPIQGIVGRYDTWGQLTYNNNPELNNDTEPQLVTFPLEQIDTMRQNLLQWFQPAAYEINEGGAVPYNLPLQIELIGGKPTFACKQNQEGLAVKTYNSDLFNNWISTEWIDGPDGISAVTAIDTSAGSFTIDELNLSRKIYDMLNRIALSGGSYDDWLDAVYTHERTRSAENPMYMGGLIQNLVFQEVISNAATADEPLGTLAGRGKLGSKRKGGKVVVKVDEPSYIMGIISLTPNIDYSQGNKWDVNLKTMNDLHKPSLDQIGFQDLITDQMAWWDTQVDNSGVTTFKSAGKQPAWINYMTNVNVVRGNFAEPLEQMFMVLNRRYNVTHYTHSKSATIEDLTTYIDPSKFNHIFADTRRDAQNFWVQVGCDITARRKMSAKVIPNL